MDDTNLPPSPAHRPVRSADLSLASLVGREFVEALDAGLRRARAADRRRSRPAPPSPAASETAVPHRQPDRAPRADPVSRTDLAPRTEMASRADQGPRADLVMALLGMHAAAILRRFETALPMVVVPGTVPRRVSRLSLTVWARGVLRGAMGLDGPADVRTPPPTAEQQVIAAALLLECAAMTLPAGDPAGTEAIGALARAIRTVRTDTVRTAPAAARATPAPVPARRS
ncbi:hypothetical protein [Streptomyces lushanensis]|uniref:hypothetical protein n=1 Tax=Streptomyces lushanensis TaxID=1434255 RepID=UPI0008335F29|nr:hypothetical protein [Streptomyces lushanensis]